MAQKYPNKKYNMNMRKILCTILLIMAYSVTYAQVITKQKIEEYTHLGDMSWADKARELSHQDSLNDNGELVLSAIKEYKGQSKSQLYKKIFNWILSMSSSDKSALLVSDETLGQIQARCYIPNIAKRSTGDNSYIVSIRPLLKFDFKEEKIRFTFTLQSFDVLDKSEEAGYVMMFGGGFGVTSSGVAKDNQEWQLKDCYPFAEKRKHPKITSSRAFVNSVSCYNIIVDRINEVLQKPLPIENESW